MRAAGRRPAVQEDSARDNSRYRCRGLRPPSRAMKYLPGSAAMPTRRSMVSPAGTYGNERMTDFAAYLPVGYSIEFDFDTPRTRHHANHELCAASRLHRGHGTVRLNGID